MMEKKNHNGIYSCDRSIFNDSDTTILCVSQYGLICNKLNNSYI